MLSEYNLGVYLAQDINNYFVKPLGLFKTRKRLFRKDKFQYMMVMELAEGESFSKLLRYELAPDLVKKLIFQLVDAVTKMHQCKLYHRDLKPGNIVYDEKTERIRIVDYGLACSEEKRQNVNICAKNFSGGTFGYLVPPGLDPKYSDIWPLLLMILFLWRPELQVIFTELFNEQARNYGQATPEFILLFFLDEISREYGKGEIKSINGFFKKYSWNLPEILKQFRIQGKIDDFFLAVFEHIFIFLIEYNVKYIKYTLAVDDLTNEQREIFLGELEVYKSLYRTKFDLWKFRQVLTEISPELQIIHEVCQTPIKLLNGIKEKTTSKMFEKIHTIGKGGFGTVIRATLTPKGRKHCNQTHMPLDTEYAIKFVTQYPQ